jgi:hypothetical protein
MDMVKLIDNPSQQDWSSFLNGFVSGNLQQSFEYGEVVKMFNPHTRVVRLLALNGEVPVSLVQGRYNRRFGFGDRMEVGGVYGFGPVVADATYKQEVFAELIAELEKHAVKDRVSEIFIYQPKRNGLLEDMGYILKNSFNVYKVNLGRNVEKLWRKIAHNKRRNVRKALAYGVKVIHRTTYEDLASFYKMHLISGKRAGFVPHPFSYFNAFFKIFGINGKTRIFLAVFDGKPVAGVFVVIHGDTAYALAAGSRNEFWRVRPNDVVHWKAMEWACKEGLSYYHMGYVSDPPPSVGSLGWGLWRWKKEWNGLLEKVMVYHKVLMPKFKKFVLSPYEKVYNFVRKLSF